MDPRKLCARSAEWVVFSFATKHGFDFSPKSHSCEIEANQRAERLSQIHPGIEFVVARTQLVKRVPTETVPPTQTIFYD